MQENKTIQQHPDYENQITTLVRSNLAPRLLAERMEDYHEKDLAEALELLKKEERGKLCRLLSDETLAGVLEYADRWQDYLAELPLRRRAAILAELEPATAAAYLQSLDREARTNVLDLLEDQDRQEILLLSSFDDGEIGSEMTTNFVTIRQGASVREAMRQLVDQAAEHDNISTLYQVDAAGTFLGAIDLKDLIIAREQTDLEDIVMHTYPYVYATEPKEDCVERLRDYCEDSVPVLDAGNKLCGVLTAQMVTQLVDDAMGDDYAKLAGLSAEEDLREPMGRSIKKRLPWLLILLGLGLLVSAVVGLFEEVMASLTLVVCFQSLILDMSGNVGTQSLAVTIRVLMDEQLTVRQKCLLVWKEAKVGLFNGLILGLLSFGAIGLYAMVFQGQPPLVAFSVSMCTGLALVVSMLLSSISGTTIPLLFQALHVDPAVASGPLITTINDLVAVVTYYGLAWLLLLHVLHL